MNEAANPGGMKIFAISLVLTVLFFVYTMVFQPGPIDTVKFPSPAGMTKESLLKQRQEWANSSPAKIENGKKLFATHFQFHVKGPELEKVLAGLNANKNSSEIGVFNLLTNGLTEYSRNKYGYIPEGDRWDMVHYLRSLLQSPASNSSTSKEWNDYLNYGL